MSIVTGTILLYHSVCPDDGYLSSSRLNLPPENFRTQLNYLRRRFQVVPLERAISPSPGEAGALAGITFDDGYGDTFRHAWPILKKMGTPATVFLTLSQVGRDWETVRGRYPGISWEEVVEMGRDPLIEFGSHGLTHTDLTRLPDRESAREIALSKTVLEERLGRPVRYFSYPHGAWNEAVKQAAVAAGYRAAFSVISQNKDLFSLRRILISRPDGIGRLRLKLSPFYWPLRKLI